ncbi:MAG: hypothetical protein ACP5E3_07660 [Bacteroidales bacterium]
MQDAAGFAESAARFKLNLVSSIRFAKLLYRAAEILLAATISILQAAGRILNAPELLHFDKPCSIISEIQVHFSRERDA